MQHLPLPDYYSPTYPNKFDKNNFNDETFFFLIINSYSCNN